MLDHYQYLRVCQFLAVFFVIFHRSIWAYGKRIIGLDSLIIEPWLRSSFILLFGTLYALEFLVNGTYACYDFATNPDLFVTIGGIEELDLKYFVWWLYYTHIWAPGVWLPLEMLAISAAIRLLTTTKIISLKFTPYSFSHLLVAGASAQFFLNGVAYHFWPSMILFAIVSGLVFSFSLLCILVVVATGLSAQFYLRLKNRLS